MMVLILSAVAVMMTGTLKRELERSMAAEAVHNGEMMENFLSFQRENITSLSKDH